MSFKLKIDIPAYCFTPLNENAECRFYIRKVLFGRPQRCGLFKKELINATNFGYQNVVLPCDECIKNRTIN